MAQHEYDGTTTMSGRISALTYPFRDKRVNFRINMPVVRQKYGDSAPLVPVTPLAFMNIVFLTVFDIYYA